MERDETVPDLGEYFEPLRRRLRPLSSSYYSVDDLVQDTYVEAYQTIRNRGPPRNPWSWLVTIGKRTAARRGPRYRGMLRCDEEGFHPEACERSPLEELVAREGYEADQRALRQLDAERQRLLEQHYRDQKSYIQIARESGSTPGAVKAKSLRARKQARHIRSSSL